MSLQVVDKECRFENGKLIVVLEGKSPEEVISVDAKQLALEKAASCGYPRIGVNGQSGSYPVDKNGKCYDDWNDQSKRGLIAAYRNDVVLMGGL